MKRKGSAYPAHETAPHSPWLRGGLVASIGRENVHKFLDVEFFPDHDAGGGVDEHVSVVVVPAAYQFLDSEAPRLGAAMNGGLARN